MVPGAPHPALSVYEHCAVDGISPDRLEELGRTALPACLRSPGAGDAVLAELEEVEISLISDASIAAVHGEFFEDPTPTDVITFPHGEILIGVETAAREAPRFGHEVERESLLYLIHGLLHLNGHDDREPEERETMHRLQESILNDVWPLPNGANGE